MELTDEILNTQSYDKVEEFKTLQYNVRNCRLEGYVKNKINKIFFGFETITPEYKHMPHLCWIYNDDIQQGFIGINTCAVGVLNALPADKGEISPVAHNSDYDCRFILEYLQNVKPIVESNKFLHIKATYYNPKAKTDINTIVKNSCKLVPMP